MDVFVWMDRSGCSHGPSGVDGLSGCPGTQDEKNSKRDMRLQRLARPLLEAMRLHPGFWMDELVVQMDRVVEKD